MAIAWEGTARPVSKEDTAAVLKETAWRLRGRAAGSSAGGGRVGHGRAGNGDAVDSGATVAGSWDASRAEHGRTGACGWPHGTRPRGARPQGTQPRRASARWRPTGQGPGERETNPDQGETVPPFIQLSPAARSPPFLFLPPCHS